MTLWDRLKMTCVLEVAVLLATSIIGFILDHKNVESTFIHSPILHILLFASCWILAPYIARYVRIK